MLHALKTMKTKVTIIISFSDLPILFTFKSQLGAFIL